MSSGSYLKPQYRQVFAMSARWTSCICARGRQLYLHDLASSHTNRRALRARELPPFRLAEGGRRRQVRARMGARNPFTVLRPPSTRPFELFRWQQQAPLGDKGHGCAH